MENFEGGSGNPEVKDQKKLGWRARLRLAAAAVGLAALSGTSDVSPSPKMGTPNEVRFGEPPKPGEIPVPKPSTSQGPKNI